MDIVQVVTNVLDYTKHVLIRQRRIDREKYPKKTTSIC